MRHKLSPPSQSGNINKKYCDFLWEDSAEKKRIYTTCAMILTLKPDMVSTR